MLISESLKALEIAKQDVERLAELSNQFRTAFLLVIPGGAGMNVTGNPEIKNFMEEKRSIYENMPLEELLAYVDACQQHLIVFSQLAQKKSKEKITLQVEASASQTKQRVEAARKSAELKRKGLTAVDKDGDKVTDETIDSGDPVPMHLIPHIKKIAKAMKVDFRTAKEIFLSAGE